MIGSGSLPSRIDGRDPQFDLESAVIARARRTEGKPLMSAARCGRALQAHGRRIVSLGQRLQALGD
jgi:hypothetical protein